MSPTAPPDTPPVHAPAACSSLPPLTAASVVCRTRDGLEPLAPTITAFLDRTPRWTIERVSARGDARLQRVIDDHHRNGSLRIRDVHYIAYVVRKAFVLAVRHDNDIELLECLVRTAPALRSRVSATLGAEEAAALGKVHVLQWFKDQCPIVLWEHHVANRAASAGHVHVLEWLEWLKREGEGVYEAELRWCNVITDALKQAASSGQIAALKWLQTEAEAQPIMYGGPAAAMEAAISSGHLPTVQFIHERSSDLQISPSYSFKMQVPVDVPFVQWLAANGYARFCEHTLALSADAGDLDVVQWLLANGQELSEYHIDSAAKLAATSGHIEILKVLRDRCSIHVYEEVLASAARSGHFAATQWIMENKRPSAFGSTYMETAAVEAAAASSHFELAEWIHAHRQYPELAIYSLNSAAASGNLSSMEWIAAHMTELRGAGSAARVAIEVGNVNILQWLSERSGPVDISDTQRAMDVAAKHGHVHVLQWLHDAGSTHCTVEAMDMAATYGHLDIVQWLHANRTEGCTTKAMDNAAANGHFEVVLFLHAHRSEGCGQHAVFGPYRRSQMNMLWWFYDHYPGVVTPNATVPPDIASHQYLDQTCITQLRRGELMW